MIDERPFPMKLVCEKCGYTWYSRAKLDWATCPNCLSRFDKRKQLTGGVGVVDK